MNTRTVTIMYFVKDKWDDISVNIPVDTPYKRAECVGICTAEKILASQNVTFTAAVLKEDSMATRPVEMYYGEMESQRWGTLFVDIPANTPDNEITETATNIAYNILAKSNICVAFVGVYHIDEEEEEDCDCAECLEHE